MLFGNRTRRATERGGAQRRTGTLLALLALLSQIVVSMLPMPAMAEMPSQLDGPAICHVDPSDQLPDSKPGKSLGHHNPDCPVCQAFQLLGSLVSPDPVAFPPASGEALATDFPEPETVPPPPAAAIPQARAPPSSV